MIYLAGHVSSLASYFRVVEFVHILLPAKVWPSLFAKMGSMGDETAQHVPVLDLDVLIVGAGPSGASLACFLGSYGTFWIVVRIWIEANGVV